MHVTTFLAKPHSNTRVIRFVHTQKYRERRKGRRGGNCPCILGSWNVEAADGLNSGVGGNLVSVGPLELQKICLVGKVEICN